MIIIIIIIVVVVVVVVVVYDHNLFFPSQISWDFSAVPLAARWLKTRRSQSRLSDATRSSPLTTKTQQPSTSKVPTKTQHYGFTQPSILSGSVNELSTGYSWEGIRQVCATLFGARHVPERLCSGPCLQRGAITSVRPFIFIAVSILVCLCGRGA